MTQDSTPKSPRPVHRREFLKTTAKALGAAALVSAASSAALGFGLTEQPAMTPPTSSLITPPIFVAHGAPTLALDPEKGEPLRAWGAALAVPKAILAISAHWEAAPLTVGSLDHSQLLYDFYGFPDPLYKIQYAAPAATDLPERIASLLGLSHSVAVAVDRHLDHGVWVPLLHLFPAAKIPVIQVSMPSSEGAAGLVALGRKLAPLAREGVLIMGSGNLVHNLRRVEWSPNPQTPAWASEFDAWAEQKISALDLDALINFQHAAPAPKLAHPSPDHYLPVLVAAGAAAELGLTPTYTLTGFEFGSISRRSVQFG